MLRLLLQEGIETIAEEIWQLLRSHPGEAVLIFLVVFVALVLFFTFIVERISPYIAILCFIIAIVLTPLLILAIYEKAEEEAIQQMSILLISLVECRYQAG